MNINKYFDRNRHYEHKLSRQLLLSSRLLLMKSSMTLALVSRFCPVLS